VAVLNVLESVLEGSVEILHVLMIINYSSFDYRLLLWHWLEAALPPAWLLYLFQLLGVLVKNLEIGLLEGRYNAVVEKVIDRHHFLCELLWDPEVLPVL